ncbi:MAG: alpha/beta fold hydrolase [Oscillatoriales cyanobacterium C42_A2020_001]|nr:alpha/beta fold hydrolase [Leptolyngbyaceae cyanobacterium C42_A2020_001]
MTLPSVILPGYLAGAIEYRALEQRLNQLGIPATTVPIHWQDWVPTIGGRSVSPIIRKIDATVQQIRQQTGASKINLIGHSAGGWLARIYLGEKPYCVHAVDSANCAWHARPFIQTLVTLGTPHTSLERWTRKNLDFVNQTYPGAFYLTDVKYVCVAGKAIFGKRQPGSWLAYSSYKMTCGRGDTWGDGITPIESAHLEGAENLIIEGATHAPKANRLWYGSPGMLEQWVSYLR